MPADLSLAAPRDAFTALFGGGRGRKVAATATLKVDELLLSFVPAAHDTWDGETGVTVTRGGEYVFEAPMSWWISNLADVRSSPDPVILLGGRFRGESRSPTSATGSAIMNVRRSRRRFRPRAGSCRYAQRLMGPAALC